MVRNNRRRRRAYRGSSYKGRSTINEKLKIVAGILLALVLLVGIASIPSIAPYHIQVEYDGQLLEDDFLYGMVCNATSVGGVKGLPTDRVVLDDGLFEVILVKSTVSVTEIAAGLQALLTHTPVEGGAVISFHASRLSFTSSRPIPWTLDGEYGGSMESCLVENRRRAIQIIQGE